MRSTTVLAMRRAQSGMPRWQDLLFSRSANDATGYFQLPTGGWVEVGTRVTIWGVNPLKFRPNLSQDGNSCIVSWAEQ